MKIFFEVFLLGFEKKKQMKIFFEVFLLGFEMQSKDKIGCPFWASVESFQAIKILT